MTELIWDGKYRNDKRVAPVRLHDRLALQWFPFPAAPATRVVRLPSARQAPGSPVAVAHLVATSTSPAARPSAAVRSTYRRAIPCGQRASARVTAYPTRASVHIQARTRMPSANAQAGASTGTKSAAAARQRGARRARPITMARWVVTAVANSAARVRTRMVSRMSHAPREADRTVHAGAFGAASAS